MVSVFNIKSFNSAVHSASGITREIKSTGRYYRDNAKTGWQTGKRLAHIKHFKPLKTLWIKFLSSISKSKVKQEHLPTILGGIGTITPVPGGTILGYGVGKIINKVTKLFK